jgi:MSHA biogenesis protein MshI
MSIVSIFSPLRLFARTQAAGRVGLCADGPALSAAAVLRGAGGRPRVAACQVFPGEQPLAGLAPWRRTHRLRGTRTSLLLDASHYQILPVEAPEQDARERAAAARWRVKDMIDYPPEDASVDCVLVPDTPGSARTPQGLAVVAPRTTVGQWMQRAHDARIELDCIDVPEMALRNLAALPAGDGARALLHVGLHRATLVMVWRGELCNSRRFDIHAAQLQAAQGPAREALLERLGLDVQRTADAFERQFHASALERLWVTPAPSHAGLADELRHHVALPVQPLQLGEWLDVDPALLLLDAARGADFLLAIGAALREEPA